MRAHRCSFRWRNWCAYNTSKFPHMGDTWLICIVDTPQTGYPTYKLQVKKRSGSCTHASPHALQHRTLPPSQGGLWSCHVSSSFGSRLPEKKGFGAATCVVAPDPSSLQGRAPVHHVFLQLRTPPPCKGGLRCATCPTSQDLASLQGRAPKCHVSYGSEFCLPVGRALMPPPHARQLLMDRGPQAFRKA
jgi:hypothetical protein